VRPHDHDTLDALLAQARGAEPATLAPLESRRRARLAVDAAERARGHRQRLVWSCAVCVAIGMTVFITTRLTTRATTIEVAASERPLRVALTSGDTVLAAPGAELELIAQDVSRREVRLTTGTALFDVVQLQGAQRFEVHTRQAHVEVRGTVFSVEVAGGRTIVRVYDGLVWVSDRSLHAGEVWVSSGPPAALDADLLAVEGQAAAALRTTAPSIIVSSLPDVTASPPMVDTHDGSRHEPTVIIVPGQLPALPLAAPASSTPTSVSPEQARSWLLAGESERALQAAQSASPAQSSAWQLLEADALRALGRYAEAVDHYQTLAQRDPSLRASAGYSGASLAQRALHDPGRALRLLDQLALDADDSPLRERASVLRVDVLLELGRHDEARLAAQRYLQREPETRVSRRMRALAP
jgi:hypothetical protein